VKSRTNARFRKALADLPAEVQEQARQAYRKFRENPWHPSLRFKQVHATLPIYSARVGLHYRAVGERQDDDTVVWFWIGSHAEYDQLLRRR
jgi:mRNA-degrading endonuclease RelE of RelBE toxin-antitoxin system